MTGSHAAGHRWIRASQVDVRPHTSRKLLSCVGSLHCCLSVCSTFEKSAHTKCTPSCCTIPQCIQPSLECTAMHMIPTTVYPMHTILTALYHHAHDPYCAYFGHNRARRGRGILTTRACWLCRTITCCLLLCQIQCFMAKQTFRKFCLRHEFCGRKSLFLC